jgi:hypothetical protein
MSAIKAKVEDATSSAKAGTEKAKAATAVLLPCLACASFYAVPRVASALELSAVGVPLAAMLGPPRRALISDHPPPSRCDSLRARLPRLDPLPSFSTPYRCSPTPPWCKSFTRPFHGRSPSTVLCRRFGLPVDPAVQQLLPLADHSSRTTSPRGSSWTTALSLFDPSMPEHHRHDQARSPPPEAELRGRPASDQPSSTQTPPEVHLYFLVLLHPWPLAASDSPRQNAAAFPLSFVKSGQGLDCFDLKSSRVLSVK